MEDSGVGKLVDHLKILENELNPWLSSPGFLRIRRVTDLVRSCCEAEFEVRSTSIKEASEKGRLGKVQRYQGNLSFTIGV